MAVRHSVGEGVEDREGDLDTDSVRELQALFVLLSVSELLTLLLTHWECVADMHSVGVGVEDREGERVAEWL